MILMSCTYDLLFRIVLYLINLEVLSFSFKLIFRQQVRRLDIVNPQSLTMDKSRNEPVLTNPIN